jgi:hypothetical protein
LDPPGLGQGPVAGRIEYSLSTGTGGEFRELLRQNEVFKKEPEACFLLATELPCLFFLDGVLSYPIL